MPSQTSQWSIVLSHTNRFVIGTKMEMCRMGPKDANTGNVLKIFNFKIVCLVVCDLKTLQLLL